MISSLVLPMKCKIISNKKESFRVPSYDNFSLKKKKRRGNKILSKQLKVPVNKLNRRKFATRPEALFFRNSTQQTKFELRKFGCF